MNSLEKKLLVINTKHWESILGKAGVYYKGKPEILFYSWREYCMESWIFRLFVKLGLRN